MKLPRITKSEITKDKNGENVPIQKSRKQYQSILILSDNDFQQNSRVLYTFVLNKFFGQLLDISPKIFISVYTFNSEFSYIEVCFTDQNFKPLEVEDKINITLQLLNRV